MFFYNSTTLFHFQRTATPVAGLSRKVNLISEGIKNGFKTAWTGTKFAARMAAKPFKIAAGTRLITGASGVAWNGAKAGLNAVETAEYTAAELVKGFGNATVVPTAILAMSPLESMWIKFRHFSMDVLGAAVKTPIALAKSPFELIRGVRDSIVSMPGNLYELAGNIFKLNFKETVASTRKFIKEALLPPITKPLAPIIAPTRKAVSTLIESEMVKLRAIKKSAEHAVGGVKQIRDSFKTARQKVALVNAEREHRAMEKAKEKEAKEKEDLKKLEEVEKAKGGKKGGK